jgi:hypothetical protein
MKLRTSHNSAKERIIDLIVSGNVLLERITHEYFEARRAGVFDQDEYVPRWQGDYLHWHQRCLDVLQEIFPTPLEAIRLKNSQPSPVYQSGTNVKWGSLTNTVRAKLSTLDAVLSSVDDYSAKMAEELFIEDIDSFAKARDINPREVKPLLPLDLSEDDIQTHFEEIIGENFHQQDWGGETDDLNTSQIKFGGRRIRAAFLLKGKGTKGKLTIRKCGKNGDQIVRLVEAPADLYVIQHVGEIDERVISDLRSKIQLMNSQGKNCQMCIIDGTDTARILKAYGKI